MDKAEYKIKLDQINKLAEAGDFRGAAGVVDSIDWKHVKSVRTLCMVGEIYEANKRYEDSKRILKYAYRRASISKTVLYRLTELDIRTGDYDEAKEYYDEYEELSPNDTARFILKYKLLRAQGAGLDEQIAVLRDYKENEYTERWAYELAKLYKKNGQNDKCVEECDDMILWFSEGKYVTKAMELKMTIRPLTEVQQEKYNNRFKAAKKAAASEIPQDDLNAFDNVEKAVRREDDDDEENRPKVSTAEVISKMNTAAVATVSNAATNDAKVPNITPDQRASFNGGNAGNLQHQLASSIRAVFAGIRTPGTEDVPVGELSKEPDESEAVSEPEDLSKVKVRELEPESISLAQEEKKEQPASRPDASEKDGDEVDGQMSLDDFMKAKPASLDLDALFAETSNSLANEVASGNFRMAAAVEDEQEPGQPEEEAEAAKPEEAEDAASRMAAEPEDELTEEEKEKQELLGKETDESLGLTREFNFHEELKKAMSGGDSLSQAARKTAEKAVSEQEDLPAAGNAEVIPNPEEEARKTVMEAQGISEEEKPAENPEELQEMLQEAPQEVPQELLADDDELNTADVFSSETLEDISEVPEKEEESSKSIIEHIMEKPETMKKIPVEPRALDETEKKLFSYFTPIPGMSEQITQTLADVHNNAGDKTSKSGNVLLMGRQGSGKSRLADCLILSICRNLGIPAAKTAKIIADDFNAKDPATILKTMSGGFLVIEGAGNLSEESIDKLSQAMEFRTDDLVVMLEDEKADLREMLSAHPELADKFTSAITIPVFTNDELVTFAKTYAKEHGYKMDEMGTLALYTMIGANQKDAEPVTVGKVKDMVDKAIDRAGSRKFTRKFSKNVSDEDGRILLREKDFNF